MGQTIGMTGSHDDDVSRTTDEMKVYLDLLKRELDEEFRIAERLDAKARGYLTAATVAIAAVQGAAVWRSSRRSGTLPR